MKMRTTAFIALLRGINVSGHNKVPMAELRSLCDDLGWRDAVTYIQSGNVVFRSHEAADRLEDQLETAIRSRFGLDIRVIVRTSEAWQGYLPGNPFPEASEVESNRVMLLVSKAPPAPDAGEALRERAVAGERVVLKDDALWIHFPAGSGRSRLSPALLDRLVGSPVTSRNWRTVLKLAEMARAASEGGADASG